MASELISVSARIRFVRGQRVVLDRDLTKLYGVTTNRLNEQVKRNIVRFPGDFIFRLTEQEVTDLRSQNAISNRRRENRPDARFALK